MENMQIADGSCFMVHIIEDSPELSKLTRKVILDTLPNIEIKIYGTKEEILSVLDSHSGPRAYIVDGSFPADINSLPSLWGPTVYQEIQARNKKIPVIGLTGYAKDFRVLGLDSLEKPVTPEEIVYWVQKSMKLIQDNPDILIPAIQEDSGTQIDAVTTPTIASEKIQGSGEGEKLPQIKKVNTLKRLLKWLLHNEDI